MRRRAAVGQALALAAVAFAHAQGADPLHSPECDAARRVLERALDDAANKQPGSVQRLATARREAMRACLGPETGERERSGAPEPAIVVPPVLQAPRAPAVPAVVAPAPPAYTPPPVVTTCDNSGCWDSNGRHIDRLGPLLVGPRGPCTVVGGTVQCP